MGAGVVPGIGIVELMVLEPSLLAVERSLLPIAKAIEDLSIFRGAHESFAGRVHGFRAVGDFPVRSIDLTRQKIEMRVCEPKRLGIELAVTGNQLPCQRFPAVAKSLTFGFRFRKRPLRGRKQQLLLFFDTFSVAKNGSETKCKSCHRYATAYSPRKVSS